MTLNAYIYIDEKIIWYLTYINDFRTEELIYNEIFVSLLPRLPAKLQRYQAWISRGVVAVWRAKDVVQSYD